MDKPYLTIFQGNLHWWKLVEIKEIKQMVQAASVRNRFEHFVLDIGSCVFAIIASD